MTLQRPTLVLFDMDGTTVRHINPRLLGLLEFLDDTAFKIGKLFAKDKGGAAYTDEAAPKNSPSLLVHRAMHHLRRREVDQIVQPCPGIYSLLNIIKAHDVPIGIVSNGLGKGYGYDILEKFYLAPFYETSIFREDFKKSKPHPDPILRALKDMKDPLTKKDVVWYIGDRHKDVTAALAADKVVDATIIPFAYGLNASVAILEKGLSPEQIIMNYHDFTLKARAVLRGDDDVKKSKGALGFFDGYDDDLAPYLAEGDYDADLYDYIDCPAPMNDNKPLGIAK